MRELRYTLIADGSSDRTLIPILNWLFDRHISIAYLPQFAAPLPPASVGLKKRALAALDFFPCDVLFVHRDAERGVMDARVAEIRAELDGIGATMVPIVPVRMTEAWLLSNEQAIRTAAGNPNGVAQLDLPRPREWDGLPDPKEVLFFALQAASGRSGRRLRGFSPFGARHRVAELTEDFSPLERLPAFAALRDAVDEAVNQFVAQPHG